MNMAKFASISYKEPQMIDQRRNAWLDLLRTIAIMLVLVSHGRDLLIGALPLAVNFRLGGYWGVELFFVLSGFLIGRLLYETFIDSPKWALNFLVRRWFRTLPNYFLFLLVKVLAVGVGIGVAFDSIYPYLTFTQNLAWRHPDFFPEAWSLSVEEVFYLLVPIALLCCWKGMRRYDVGYEKVVLIVVGLFAVFSIALRLYFANDADVHWDADIRKIVVFRFDALMFGFLAYLVYKKHKLPVQGLVAFGGALLLLSAIIALGSVESLDASYFAKTALFPITTLGFCLILLGGMYANFQLNNQLTALVRKISMWSYSMYLSHLTILELVKLKGGINLSSSVLGFVFWLTLTIAISAFVYEFFEKIILKFRDNRFPTYKGMQT